MAKKELYAERNKLYDEFAKAFETNKIIYIGCHTGWGKTITVRKWLDMINMPYTYTSADNDNFFEYINEEDFPIREVIVLDDLFCISNEDDENELVDFVARTNAKFVLIGRGMLPPYLKPFYTTRQLKVFDEKDFAFSINEMEAFFEKSGIELSKHDLTEIYTGCCGYPLAISCMLRHLENERYSKEMYDKNLQDVWDWYDYAVFQRFTIEMREFIMVISILDEFTAELARMVTGKNNAEKILTDAMKIGSFITFTPPDTYSIYHNIFKQYLNNKLRQNFSPENVNQLYQNAGLFYELNGDITNALKYYSMAKNTDKLSSLLLENSKNNAVNADFHKNERYYLEIPNEKIMQSPDLMCAMSMLYSLKCQPEKSEMWFDRLNEFFNGIDKKDARYKIAKSRILYLKIALPHRGSMNNSELFLDTAKLCMSGKFSIHDISITGDMPSVLHGGKDFCQWTGKDRKYYTLLKKPFEIVMGKYATGLADIALGESLYEKCEDMNFTEPMAYINNGLSQASLNGTPAMKFAGTGVITKIFLAQGSMETAKKMVANYIEETEKIKTGMLNKNARALQILLAMYDGESDWASDWMRSEAPDETKTFYILLRYQYMVKVRAYIVNSMYPEALSLLERLRIYYESYFRKYEVIQTKLLKSIVLFRMKNDEWKDELTQMLDMAKEYNFTRMIADEGMGVLELLTKIKYSDKEYLEKLIRLARRQAVLYPSYMMTIKKIDGSLTDMEKTVLKLCAQ